MNFLLLYRFMANLYITYTSCCHDTEGHYHSVLFVFWELAALGVEISLVPMSHYLMSKELLLLASHQ